MAKKTSKAEGGATETVAEVFSEGLKKLEAALKLLPKDVLAKAQKEADQILQGDVSWADLSQYTPEKLLKIAEMGYNQFQLGESDSAERLFKGLSVIEPRNFYYHQMLGAIYQKKDRTSEAIVEYTISVDLNPKDLVSLTNRGEVYFKLGVNELAAADFDQAIALDPKSEDKWANRARMLKEQVTLMQKRKK